MRSRFRRITVVALGAAALVGGALSAVQPVGAQASPSVVVMPNEDRVGGYGWADGATIDLTIDDPDLAPAVDYSAQTVAHPNTDPVHGDDFIFDLSNVFDIQPGHVVMVSDGTTTKTHIVTELALTDVDAVADTVSGTAAPGSDVHVGGGPDPGHRLVQADGAGNWTADFSVPGPGPDEQDLLDIQDGTCCVNAHQRDADDDITEVFQQSPPPPPASPELWVDPIVDQVLSGPFVKWPAGATVVLEIDDPSNGVGVDYTDSTVAQESIDGPFGQFFAFRFETAGFDIEPGHEITVSDGQSTKIHSVTELAVTGFDHDTGTVSGTATPGSAVSVIYPSAGFEIVNTQADPVTGVWTATASTGSASGSAYQADSDNDRTAVTFNFDARVEGTVLDGAGQVPGPTAGAVACPGEWVFAPGVPPSPPCVFGFANAAGEYTISDLEPGIWTIGAFGTAGGALVGAGTPHTLDLPAGTTSGIDFVFGSRVQGVVTSSGGDPVAGVTVELVSGGVSGGVLTATLTGGDYTTPYLGAGTYGLRFVGPDGLSFAEASVTLGVDETLTRDVQLQLGSKLQGSVLGDGGVPGSGAAICPGTGGVSLGCEGFRIAPADAGGNFVMPSVAAGTYSVVGFQFGDPVVTSPNLVITTAPGDIVTCMFTIGTSPGSSCSGAASGTSVAAEAGAGDTVTTDTAGTGATEEDPLQADVTTPNEGLVTIMEEAAPAPEEWPPIGEEQLNISAPEATTADPLVLVFRIDASEIVGLDLDRIEVLKDGVVVLDCTGTPGHADPDPCVSNRVLLDDGDAEITVLSSTASVWRFAYSPFDFDGFSAPVNNPPTLNSVKAGRAIPVKFSLGGDLGLDVFAEGYPKSQQISCNDDVPTDGIEETVTAVQSSLSYDAATDTYTYVWKTDSNWGDTCRQLVVKLADGAVHRANFEFK